MNEIYEMRKKALLFLLKKNSDKKYEGCVMKDVDIIKKLSMSTNIYRDTLNKLLDDGLVESVSFRRILRIK